MSEEPKKRKSAHEKIMELRKEFGIPEEETTEAEDKFYFTGSRFGLCDSS